MNPQEKAEYLIKKFNNVSIICDTRGIDDEDAIKFILLAIDEVIMELKDIQETEHYTYERVAYWNEVKEHLTNLK